jgi:phage-related protein
LNTALKPLAWVGSSKKDLVALPESVRRFFGHALDFAQRGDRHDAAKVLKGFDGAGVLELIEDDIGGNYRTIYTVRFEEVLSNNLREKSSPNAKEKDKSNR